MANISVATFTDLNTACQTSNTITVTAPITFTSSITIPAGVTVSISGSTLTSSTAKQKHFLNNGNLTLTNITLDGGGGVPVSGASGGGGISMPDVNAAVSALPNPLPSLTLDAGSVIQNCTTDTVGVSSAIYVLFGNLELNGTLITNNYSADTTNGGAAIYLNSPSATCVMNAPTVISNNSSVNAGGAIHLGNGANFIMNGGQILNNSALNNGGGIVMDNFNNNATHNIDPSNTTATTFTMNGGQISGNKSGSGGGILSDVAATNYPAVINISAGEISNNVANLNGGGIFLRVTTLNMTGGLVDNNSAVQYNGGGIYIGAESIATITGTSTPTAIPPAAPATGTPAIVNNTAAGDGGGLYLTGSETTVTTSDVLISGNIATNGGGYYVVP